MQRTHTAERCFALLKSLNVSAVDIQDLGRRSEAVAQTRGSPKVGFRHLVIAQGLNWGTFADAHKGEANDPTDRG